MAAHTYNLHATLLTPSGILLLTIYNIYAKITKFVNRHLHLPVCLSRTLTSKSNKLKGSMVDHPSSYSSVECDVRLLCSIIARLNVRSLSDAGSNVCEMFHGAMADVSELNARLIIEQEFRESTGAKLSNQDVLCSLPHGDAEEDQQLAQVIPFISKRV